MLPKGATTVLPALRGKQTRLDGASDSGGLDKAKALKEGSHGAAAPEKARQAEYDLARPDRKRTARIYGWLIMVEDFLDCGLRFTDGFLSGG
ncbi:hypothetical protein NDU88_003484 [Pleurodeles waltl]|uniref:Uncharacterized protein n=1 Tax=Pleurodeles waltl TaxID=8319 RepID=A0AAV7UCX7_PLEWA|nr:hypothetical protein NDU88_003484 [Pleurodeles waltl]